MLRSFAFPLAKKSFTARPLFPAASLALASRTRLHHSNAFVQKPAPDFSATAVVQQSFQTVKLSDFKGQFFTNLPFLIQVRQMASVIFLSFGFVRPRSLYSLFKRFSLSLSKQYLYLSPFLAPLSAQQKSLRIVTRHPHFMLSTVKWLAVVWTRSILI